MFPIPIEPHYDPASPYAGNAAMSWVRAHQFAPYIGQDGTVSANGAATAGTWVDAPDGPPINGTFPQKWVPSNPSDPAAAIYTVATLYGRGGIDKWVLSPEAETALAEARATIVPVPADVNGPVAAPPTLPPGVLARLDAMPAHFRAYF